MRGQNLKLVDPAQSDARDSTRKSVEIDCTIKSEETLAPARLLDLSLGGAFISCSQDLIAGSEIALIIKLPGQDPTRELSVQAEVVHVGRFLQGFNNFTGVGLRFIHLSPDQETVLQNILDSAKSLPSRKYILY